MLRKVLWGCAGSANALRSHSGGDDKKKKTGKKEPHQLMASDHANQAAATAKKKKDSGSGSGSSSRAVATGTVLAAITERWYRS